MNYDQLFTAIQAYTENQFPAYYTASGSTLSSTQQLNRFIGQAELRIYNTVQIPALRKNVTGAATISTPYVSCPDDFLSAYSMAVVDPITGAYSFLLNKDVNFIREAYPAPSSTGTPKHYAMFGSRYSNPNELSFIVGPTPDKAYAIELHYYYYPVSIIQNVITAFGVATAGAGYVNGTYANVALTGGSGDGVIATITVAGGVVTGVVLVDGGSGYFVGNTLTTANTNLGGTGLGFSVPVGTVNNATGTTWLGDNFDTVLLYGALVEAYTYMKGEADMLSTYSQKYMEALEQLKRLGDGLDRQDAYRSGQARIGVT